MRLLAAILLLLAAALPAGARSWSAAPAGGDGTLASLPWAAMLPGDEVAVADGTYGGPVVIAAQGTQDAPITVRAAPGAAPVVTDSIILEGAAHLSVEGLAVDGSPNSGFILRRGTHDVTVAGSTVRNSGLGIWIGDAAGDGIRLAGNELYQNRTHGIAVDVINARQGHETVISGNRVHDNGIHGMEINGSRYIVERNLVWDNGRRMSGTSGIHLYARDAGQDAGDDNIVRYNISYNAHDETGQDGNGIQVDQWCDRNQVYHNLAFGNDGAGINLFDAADNQVWSNTLYGNMRDPGASHLYRGQLVIASDYTRDVDHAYGNLVADNLIVATGTGVAVYVETRAAARKPAMGGNLLFAQAGARLYSWGAETGEDIAGWNALHGGSPDLSADPRFLDPQAPLAGGLRPRGLSPGAALSGLPAAGSDLAGRSYLQPPVGAYVSDP